ncbi:MAG: translation initiation factor IF-2 [Spirochaetes bacterium]|nr:translation initiation factor IF-2 [Spirochaetota bacterium]
MKTADIAVKNHVSIEHIIKICEELGITCKDENSDISEKDLFLVEKKIEVIKTEKTKKTIQLIEKKGERNADSNSGKKIKLKRKVHVSKGLIKDKAEKEPDTEKIKSTKIKEEKTPSKEEKKPERYIGQTQRETKPDRFKSRDAGKDKQRTGQARPTAFQSLGKGGPTRPKSTETAKESIKEHTKETSRRKLHGKDKDKNKKFKEEKFKEEKFIEKDIVLRKKKPIENLKREIVTPGRIEITENLSVGDLAHKLNIKANEVIAKLMKLGVMATINQIIDSETAEILAGEYNTEVKVVSLFEETVIKSNEIEKPEDLETRPPVVTIMGHVDHGKTKLLDTIRKTNVMDQEFGGITQHIGAYKIFINDHHITFLDTPGHAAFTTMRARGAGVTDIVVLVVAVNDGVMPQTIEAINHAKDAGVPTVVALNKIDLADANPQKVKQELSNYGLVPEEWGGHTLYAEISAKNNINIDKLLELILIQAEMLELKANLKIMARGTVLESRIDRGRGSVPTILVQQGILKVGDPFVVGVCSGKVRAMFDDKGNPIDKATPSTPVEVLGITGIPSAGDPFQVVESEKYSKQISNKRQELKRVESAKKVKKVTLENLNEMIREGEIQELKVIIKADVDGSVQALHEELQKLSTGDIRVKVIHSGTGTINESDVILASASNAIIIGYHIRPTAKIADLAEKESVSIQLFNIIFEATASIKAAMQGMLKPDYKEEIIGSGEIIKTFKISKVGTIAGSMIHKGKVQRSNSIRLIRDGIVIYNGKLKSLKRYQDDASEVSVGQECGFTIDGFNDIKVGDTFEAYTMVEVAKTLDS